MTTDSPARDFLLPRLTALVNEATATGFARDVAVAVLIDLVTSPGFDTAAPSPMDDSTSRQDWNRDENSIVLVDGMIAKGPTPPGAQDEADFVKPFGWTNPS